MSASRDGCLSNYPSKRRTHPQTGFGDIPTVSFRGCFWDVTSCRVFVGARTMDASGLGRTPTGPPDGGYDIVSKRYAQLDLIRPRRHEVRSAERGQKVVERILVREIEHAEADAQLHLVGVQKVVDSGPE